MAVKTSTAPTMVTFPDQQTIVQFYDSHPAKPIIDTLAHACGADSVQKVSNFFAGKKMHLYEIKSHVVTVLDPTGELPLSHMDAKAQKLVAEEEDHEVVKKDLQEKLKKVFQPTYFELGVTAHETILRDLWDKEVQKLTNNQ